MPLAVKRGVCIVTNMGAGMEVKHRKSSFLLVYYLNVYISIIVFFMES